MSKKLLCVIDVQHHELPTEGIMPWIDVEERMITAVGAVAQLVSHALENGDEVMIVEAVHEHKERELKHRTHPAVMMQGDLRERVYIKTQCSAEAGVMPLSEWEQQVAPRGGGRALSEIVLEKDVDEVVVCGYWGDICVMQTLVDVKEVLRGCVEVSTVLEAVGGLIDEEEEMNFNDVMQSSGVKQYECVEEYKECDAAAKALWRVEEK